MTRYFSIAALTGLVIGVAGCSSTPVGSDPSLTTAQRDQAQREAMRPPAVPGASYETVIVDFDFPVPLDQFSKWFAEKGASEFSVFMTGTASRFPLPSLRSSSSAVLGAVYSDALIGSWKTVGDRRRVIFADGTSALEEMTAVQLPRRFQYEVWNLTNDTGRYINYALSDFRFSGSDRGTHIRWEYSFRPEGLPDGWFISRFVHEDFRQFMEATLTAMGKQARAEAVYDETAGSAGTVN
jgi:Polyketide cyclase / dehydrase and lipid transport